MTIAITGLAYLRSRALAATLAGAALALSAGLAGPAKAADAAAGTATAATTTEKLQEVVVTGSLIPQVKEETFQPVTVITAEDIQAKGFTSVSEALQHSSFATGSIQGAGYSGGFTQGAETLSLFGLAPGYTKYLIDGRPLADYPALYNGRDAFASISGIPTILVDHVDVLPGGQSSIYGSDAIAGVINISLKKKLESPEADVRYGWTKDGGGSQMRVGLADGINFGSVNIVIGGQYEKIDPIWGYQRPKTDQYFAGGSTPQLAERDYLAFGLLDSPNYYFEDPNGCAKTAGQFGGGIGLQNRAGHGQYCGTTRAGFYTVGNGEENTQGYLHVSDDINPHLQVFTDVLASHEITRFGGGPYFFGTNNDPSNPFYYFVDPNVPDNTGGVPGGDLLNLQRIFSPEEGGLNSSNDKNTQNSIRATLGITGDIGASAWKYTADWTYTQSKLNEARHVLFTSQLYSFLSQNYFGPNLGPDPIFGQPQYNVNWTNFYTPLTNAQYQSFSGWTSSNSRTEDSLVRGQVTNSDLFKLPGGNAGVALLVEGGDQGWEYTPDVRLTNGEAYLNSSAGGSGHRSRWATTGELRLPVLSQVTVDMSGRYDDYRVAGGSVSKFTYNLGVEYRPVKTLLVRGRYGTAFKAPTLPDTFQGKSGYYQAVTDYYTCAQMGFKPGNPPPNDIDSCFYSAANNNSVHGTIQGTPGLKPITADVADIGIAWSPLEHSSFSVDYLYWRIKNEVQAQSSDQLSRTESACRLGELDPTSPTCVNAEAQVTRDPLSGLIVDFFTPKQNQAEENLDVLAFQATYAWVTHAMGTFTLEGAYTDMLKHSLVQYPGDAPVDLLSNPYFSTDFRTKGNLALGWDYAKFGMTVYGEYYGKSPNNISSLSTSGYAATGGAKLPAQEIMNVSARYEVFKGLTVSANVNNVFNRMPPLDNTYTGNDTQPYNSLNYNINGVSYFVGANYKFGK